jgi:hypothetical protein
MEARETVQFVRQVKWAELCRFSEIVMALEYRVRFGRYGRNNRRDSLSACCLDGIPVIREINTVRKHRLANSASVE